MTKPTPGKQRARSARPAPARQGAAGVAGKPGGWLRRQRQARGWAVPEMARKLRDTARLVGDELPERDVLIGMIRRWERDYGVSERYRLHYCRAFGIDIEQFGTGEPAPPALAKPPAEPATPGTLLPVPVASPGWPVVTPSAALAYRGIGEPEQYGSWIAREVLMGAHDNSDHAEQSEHREIGDATLEQFRAEVIQLSRASMTGEPLALLMEMRRVRERMHAALDRRLWPRDESEIYLLLGCLSNLTAVVAAGLGYKQAAEEMIRAGWAYATVIDHWPLKAHLRLQLASICFWDDQPQRARGFAADGLRYLEQGPTAAHLHVKYARAAARLGEAENARSAISAAMDAREREHPDEITEMGGEFRLSMATQRYFAGSALAELDGALNDAAHELDEAASGYATGPGPGEQHWFGGKALADIDRAAVRLRTGSLDTAVAVLDPVLSLPRGQRITAVTIQLRRVRAELAHPIYRGSVQARELGERVEEFCRQTVVADLHSLPGG